MADHTSSKIDTLDGHDYGCPNIRQPQGARDTECEECGYTYGTHEPGCRHHPDFDPTPWCSGCGARRRSDCDCGPLAEND